MFSKKIAKEYLAGNLNLAKPIFRQAYSGVLVSMIIKYGDNIIKNFTSAVTLVVTSLISYFFLDDLAINAFFLCGSTAVVTASLLYHNAISNNNSNNKSKADVEKNVEEKKVLVENEET